MVRKTKEEAERTRERILDAAVRVFSERGVARPSLTDVAALVGMTRGAVYGHFRNKGEVLVALFDREEMPWEPIDEAVARDDVDPLGALRHGLVHLLRSVCECPSRRRTLHILFHKVELTEESEELVRRIQTARAEALERFATLLARAVAAGQLPAGLDVSFHSRFLLVGVSGAIWDWLFDPAAFDLSAEAGRMVDALLCAVRTSGDGPSA